MVQICVAMNIGAYYQSIYVMNDSASASTTCNLFFDKPQGRRKSIFAESPTSVFEETPMVPLSDQIWDTFQRSLKDNVLFRNLSESCLINILQRGCIENFAEGSQILSQGDDGDKFYIILEGESKVVKNGQTVAMLSTGDYFGEICLLHNGVKRNATITTISNSSLYVLRRQTFQKYLMVYFESQRLENENLLKNVHIIGHLPEDVIRILAESLRVKSFHKGAGIVVKDQPGDEFYIVQCGVVRVMNDYVDELHEKGYYFGELSLLFDQVRQASVYAHTDVDLLCLDRFDFGIILGRNADLLHAALEYGNEHNSYQNHRVHE